MVVGDDGSPIIRDEPILSREMFDRVGVELSGRENRKEPTKRSSGLLLRPPTAGVWEPRLSTQGWAGPEAPIAVWVRTEPASMVAKTTTATPSRTGAIPSTGSATDSTSPTVRNHSPKVTTGWSWIASCWLPGRGSIRSVVGTDSARLMSQTPRTKSRACPAQASTTRWAGNPVVWSYFSGGRINPTPPALLTIVKVIGSQLDTSSLPVHDDVPTRRRAEFIEVSLTGG
ncbi:hypothetical protein BKA16_000616 [Gordonia humi]|uniref:Uncharacterized protein n=1 Tax=Gordonia humi TaxID=686429 RepID=A0A840EUN9_9ACTN|nr:hypothetical protein [Gordonia humi]